MNQEKIGGRKMVKCILCGEEIVHPKGARKDVPTREQIERIHREPCKRVHDEVVQKWRVGEGYKLSVLMNALVKIHEKEIKEDEGVKEYFDREKQAKGELEEIFPYMKEQRLLREEALKKVKVEEEKKEEVVEEA